MLLKIPYSYNFQPQNPSKSLQMALTKFTQGRRQEMSDFQIKISPRVFNIFYPNLFYSETMNLLHRFRTFPALSEVFGKMRNYTYNLPPSKEQRKKQTLGHVQRDFRRLRVAVGESRLPGECILYTVRFLAKSGGVYTFTIFSLYCIL